uniref:Uncharacterized protein n=1 Tax=Rhizophora mucronata TaxID=61149 RepID=A0A2P2QYI0_RHIMU
MTKHLQSKISQTIVRGSRLSFVINKLYKTSFEIVKFGLKDFVTFIMFLFSEIKSQNVIPVYF